MFKKRNLFYFLVLIVFFILSLIDSSPFYGKTRFIYLNTFWQYFTIEDYFKNNYDLDVKNVKFLSDVTTEYSFNAAYGVDVKHKWRDHNKYKPINILDLIARSKKENKQCIINLKGFKKDWVPEKTGHWQQDTYDTSLSYEYKGFTGKKIATLLNRDKITECLLLKDKVADWANNELLRYYSPNLNYTDQQQDVHILQFPHKNSSQSTFNVMIDTGYKGFAKDTLLDYLAENEINSIDLIIITHPHKDHYSGLYDLISFGIPIQKIIFNMPRKEFCDSEKPWGCDLNDLQNIKNIIIKNKIQLEEKIQIDPQKTNILYEDDFNKLSILFANDPKSPINGYSDINDLSIILQLKSGNMKYLFTGDLNNPLSGHLKLFNEFESIVLKVPHHGAEGVASNEFFNTVSPKIAIVPSPSKLWCTDRSKRVREYLNDNSVDTLISGFHGHILLQQFDDSSIKINTQYYPLNVCGKINFSPNYIFQKFKKKLER